MNNYLSKVLYIIEKDSKQNVMLPNDVKLIFNVIGQLDTEFFMAKNKAIYSVEKPSKNAYFSEYAIFYGVCYGGNCCVFCHKKCVSI